MRPLDTWWVQARKGGPINVQMNSGWAEMTAEQAEQLIADLREAIEEVTGEGGFKIIATRRWAK